MVNNKVNVKEIEDLIKIISKLRGLGPKSARRIVLQLINNREELIKPLTNTLAQVYKNVVRCRICGNLKSSNSNCVCSVKKFSEICVVENLADMFVMQNSGIHLGYHILGGTLPSFESKNSDSGLLIESLVNRVKKNSIKEIILCTSAGIEGETTAHYIADSLKEFKNLKITRLARGVPVGGEIEHLDDGTLFSAFKNRAPIISD